MTITTLNNIVQTPSDGVNAAFPFTFDTQTIASILVFEDNTLTVLPYTVVLSADQESAPGGVATFDAAVPANGILVTVIRVEVLDQLTNYTVKGKFPSASHENALDKLTRMVQQQQEILGRMLFTSFVDNAGMDYEFPPYSADKLIGWHATDKKLINITPSGGGGGISPIYLDWTPELVNGSDIATDHGISYISQVGQSVRIGDLVTVWGTIRTSNMGTLVGSLPLAVKTLPYISVAEASEHDYPASVTFRNGLTGINAKQTAAYIIDGNDILILAKETTTSLNPLLASNVVESLFRFDFSITYLAEPI